ncbi:hypothetical protein COCNU_08G005050 [Cocos nucifera]|uniref:Uncharacterized protein n=1 Tax=Cocos nucifera TaxID=13894 RepID=A0A8K0IHJ4_COCNU|nr:hypothetical protein COCNU_08G005050 [Cocos nucifera]
MRSLKGKKRQRYRERFIAGNRKYEEAARELLTPKTGYGLASELRRAGVFLPSVEDKAQAAGCSTPCRGGSTLSSSSPTTSNSLRWSGGPGSRTSAPWWWRRADGAGPARGPLGAMVPRGERPDRRGGPVALAEQGRIRISDH